jgi:hypothetical protein
MIEALVFTPSLNYPTDLRARASVLQLLAPDLALLAARALSFGSSEQRAGFPSIRLPPKVAITGEVL